MFCAFSWLLCEEGARIAQKVEMREGKHLVGVDIGTTAIKVCQLKPGRKGLELLRFGYEALGSQVVVDGQVMDSNVVTEVIQKIFKQHKIRQRDVAVSVSGQAAIIRKITVPLMTDAELSEQIQWEAEQHIPFDIKDVQVDYQVLGRHPDEGQMEVLLVAAKRDQIEDYAQLVRAAKLRPIVCDIDAFSIQNFFESSRGLHPDQTFAIVNSGATLSSLNVVAGGVSAFTREIANGGNAVTEEIQRTLGIGSEQAEAYKCGGSPDGIVPDQVMQIIEGSCDSIAAEIQRSLDFFMATSGDSNISRIYVTGGSANLPSLAQAVEQRSRIPVETWIPTEGLAAVSKEVDQELLRRVGLQLAVPLGLALRKDREARA
jgi:type IV pilus assembly protein PilM